MGIFDRDKPQAAAAVPITTVDFQPMSITADQLQCIVDDWQDAEHAIREELANRGEQLWAQAQAAVAAQNVEEFVRLGEILATGRPNFDQLDLRDAIYSRINKVQYTPGMMQVVEMIGVSFQANSPATESRIPAADQFEYKPIFTQ